MATLTKAEIRSALTRIGALATERGEIVRLVLLGGALMALAHDARDSTKDVDAVAVDGATSSLVRDLAKVVAGELSWPPDWLNDGAKGYLVGISDGDLVFEAAACRTWRKRKGYRVRIRLGGWRWALLLRDRGWPSPNSATVSSGLFEAVGGSTVDAPYFLVASMADIGYYLVVKVLYLPYGGSRIVLEPESRLRSLFRRSLALDMPSIMSGMAGRSMRSLYRDLSRMGYLSSYTHAGRYYTLAEIADFDRHGIWFHQGIGFSRAGTLKETAAVLVGSATAGKTHPELESLVRVRVHNTLLGLVEEKRIGRERIGRLYLYVSPDVALRTEQVERRHALLAAKVPIPTALPTELVIAVLVEALQASGGLAPGTVIAARLAARGQEVSAEQVERVYAEFQLVPGKKTAEPP